MKKDKRTELQKNFEAQTPTIKNVKSGNEYNLVYCSWLEFQIEKPLTIDWVKTNREILSIRAIEKAIGCPTDTLQKAVNGSQNLPKKWIEPLQQYLTGLIKPEARGQNIKTD